MYINIFDRDALPRPAIDDWLPTCKEDELFTHGKDAIHLPVSEFYNLPKDKFFDSFILVSPKRCYNQTDVRWHICQYLNYFEKFYDVDKELYFYYCRMKSLIDLGYSVGNNVIPYTYKDFMHDISTYILSDSMYAKVDKMIDDNYNQSLSSYKNKEASLQYTDKHGKYFMEISIFQNILIPIIMHFAHINHITENIEGYLLNIYGLLFQKRQDDADMHAKLFETVYATILNDSKQNKMVWDMNPIRGIDINTAADNSIQTLIIQVMPKYRFNKNMVALNLYSIKLGIRYTVTHVQYDYDFVSLSASNRTGEDNSSQVDKFEALQIKENESLFILNQFHYKKTMENIRQQYGEVSEDEIQFYRKELSKGKSDGKGILNPFRFKLISSMFAKYFGNMNSIKLCNIHDFIELIIIAKRILLSMGMKQLPYIIAGRIVKINNRNNINKKELQKLESSEYYQALLKNYRTDKVEKAVQSLLGQILTSEFECVDYDIPEQNGLKIEIISDYLIDEIPMFLANVSEDI